jgi:hypothetical protein
MRSQCAELLTQAQRAALDEIEHARIAYALASHYAGQPLGPAGFDACTAPIDGELEGVLVALVEEACVGETVGVAEASYLAAVATDPTAARVHARIAKDETRHAALAWRTLSWGLERADAGTRDRVAEAFERAGAALLVPPLREARVTSREHGLLAAPELWAVRRQALLEVVMPCARAALAVATRQPGREEAGPRSDVDALPS